MSASVLPLLSSILSCCWLDCFFFSLCETVVSPNRIESNRILSSSKRIESNHDLHVHSYKRNRRQERTTLHSTTSASLASSPALKRIHDFFWRALAEILFSKFKPIKLVVITPATTDDKLSYYDT